ncbi:MAG: DUF438 domain-containing protein [Spirochaetota bacterium]
MDDMEATMEVNAGISSERQAGLAAIIKRLHDGEPVSKVRRDFAKLIEGVSAGEIAEMEQSLVDGGMPVEEIQRLCEVHVEVFSTALEKGERSHTMPGHPVHSYLAENREAASRIRSLLGEARRLAFGRRDFSPAKAALAELRIIEVHYQRKENQLFPWLEQKRFTGPSKVMWGKHDEIRAQFKAVAVKLEGCEAASLAGERRAAAEAAKGFRSEAGKLAGKMRRMFFMEERILFPNALSRLSELEWADIRQGEDAIGFAWIQPGAAWDPEVIRRRETKAPSLSQLVAHAHVGMYDGPGQAPAIPSIPAPPAPPAPPQEAAIPLSTGSLPLAVLNKILCMLPVDMSFVDADDRVAWYSDSPHRIFPRSPGAIGRNVKNCHPPKSLAAVEQILASFRSGQKDTARFWIEMGGRFIVIEYFAVRDLGGSYLGTFEMSQDATEIRGLVGQRRLLDWEAEGVAS